MFSPIRRVGLVYVPSLPRYSLRSRAQAQGAVRHLAGFSMGSLKDLRSRSGAPIVECKKALENTSNLDEAMDWLREHGAAKASSKVEGREATEGLVSFVVSDDGKKASIVKVASETDFAGRSEKFVSLLVKVANATLNVPGIGELSPEDAMNAESDGQTVKDLLDEAIVAIRENLTIMNAVKMESDDGFIVGYVHNRVGGSDAGTAAAIVELAGLPGGATITHDELQAVGKKLAMHAVAAKPQFLCPEDVDQDIVEKERQIQTKLLVDSGKPAEIVPKIVEGKLRKLYEGICLTEQPHMIEEKNPKVASFLKKQGLELKRFVLLSI